MGWEKHAAGWLSPRSKKPGTIDAVDAAGNLGKFALGKRVLPGKKPWYLPYKERTKLHAGFFDVDMYSLFDASALNLKGVQDLDVKAWEHRDVKQRFLHEQSLSFSRNWFGHLSRTRGNDKYKAPFCRPQSMEMPMDNIPDPGEWTAEWYTTWKSPFEKQRVFHRAKSAEGSLSASERSDKDDDSCFSDEVDEKSSSEERSLASIATSSSQSDGYSDDESWEDAPECGEIINVKQKIGERVTRVHPDYTSSLRRSRWRKKYFPRGTFPYK